MCKHSSEPLEYNYTPNAQLRKRIHQYGYSRRFSWHVVYRLSELADAARNHEVQVPSAKAERWLADKAVALGVRHDDALSIAMDVLRGAA